MKYEIEADWITNLLCSYNCSYCFCRSSMELDGVTDLPPQRYLDFFDRTGKTWMLHMTGGEPFVHERVVDVMAVVAQHHYLSINTNGTQTSRMNRFARTVLPERVEYIHVGCHWRERSRSNGWESLYGNMRMLVDHGFRDVFASLVMEPSVIAEYPAAARRMLDETGCVLVPKLMRDQRYPAGYTQAEREAIASCVDEVLRMNPALAAKPYTVNPLHDRKYLNGFPDFRGHACRAGRDFVQIDETGTIWRCERRERLGNIATGELRLHQESRVCRERYCPYFCLKYSHLTNA